MKKISMAAMAMFFVLASCKKDAKKEAETVVDGVKTETEKAVETITSNLEVKKVKVTLEPRSNTQSKGSVVFTEEEGVVTMVAVFEGLAAGDHAIHLHEKADCSAPDATSTGGHWNPLAKPHGKWGDAAGYHKGDIGNFTADANGNGTITFITDEWCIGCGDTTKDILQKAVIVHAGKDDFKTQPTGDAGGRVSCGGIIQ